MTSWIRLWYLSDLDSLALESLDSHQVFISSKDAEEQQVEFGV